jgi:FkbH-like protein
MRSLKRILDRAIRGAGSGPPVLAAADSLSMPADVPAVVLTGEPVRLIIWDLDETLWRGTLTEGGIEFRREVAELVIDLARRGIMSSICSKNDHDVVMEILQGADLWEYFIFPDISWEAKGPRIARLIEAVQLRPASVLFVDDNPANLEEARHFTPELRTVSDAFIPMMGAHPLLQGKPDPEMKRLAQYKSLQRRQVDLAQASTSVESFLRKSGIAVAIEHDVSAHLDRAIELINRTNQLNFTKLRLPEDIEAARGELTAFLGRHDVQAGLVRVVDRYGDHGFAGFYAFWSADQRLLHYCFSCRILGMGVEQWLFEKLQRPKLDIVGEVLSDPREGGEAVDWIELQAPLDLDSRAPMHGARTFDWVGARGGCDIGPLLHYFGMVAGQASIEFNPARDGFDPRIDHSMFLRYAIDGLSAEALAECAKIGYRPSDFESALFAPPVGRGVWLLSFWADSLYALYRHKRLGFLLPWARPFEPDHERDVRQTTAESLPMPQRGNWIAPALERLKQDYEFAGLIGEAEFKQNMNVILAKAPPGTPVVMLKRVDFLIDEAGVRRDLASARRFNRWLTDVAAEWPSVRLADVRDYVLSDGEIRDWLHFDRLTYHRLFRGIEALLAEGEPIGQASPPDPIML